MCSTNSTPNLQVLPLVIYKVIADNDKGLLFKCKRDRKIINADPKVSYIYNIQGIPGDNSTRTQITTNEYAQIIIYDHMTRRKS